MLLVGSARVSMANFKAKLSQVVLTERKQRLETGQATVSSWDDAKKRLNELGNEN